MSAELARFLDVGKVTLGGLIDRLETAGYVSRQTVDLSQREVEATELNLIRLKDTLRELLGEDGLDAESFPLYHNGPDWVFRRGAQMRAPDGLDEIVFETGLKRKRLNAPDRLP